MAFCSQCGSTLDQRARFCGSCGSRSDATVAVSADARPLRFTSDQAPTVAEEPPKAAVNTYAWLLALSPLVSITMQVILPTTDDSLMLSMLPVGFPITGSILGIPVLVLTLCDMSANYIQVTPLRFICGLTASPAYLWIRATELQESRVPFWVSLVLFLLGVVNIAGELAGS